MIDPYLLLDVPEDAGDDAVQEAYLRRVRQYPPDRAPAEFQETRAAFELIRSQRERLHHALFCTELPGLAEIALPLMRQAKPAPRRPGEAQLLKVLAALAVLPNPEA
ncbi:MAG: J domain-containing protein [Thermodesulfobacteriota bacterium]